MVKPARRTVRKRMQKRRMEHVTVRFPRGLIRAIQQFAEERDMDFSDFSRKVLAQYVGYDPLRDERDENDAASHD